VEAGRVEKRKKIAKVSDRRGNEGEASGHEWNAATGASVSNTEICDTATLENHL
jgi:hypothetical protein